jgi:hypothetical protein
MSKHKVKRYAGEDESMVGISAQTEEEAANETALNADLPRRKMMGAAAAEGARDEKAYSGPATAPEAMPVASPKAKGVTKEELAKSGMSLRDYMNKQQGLTRRGDSAAAASYSNEGRGSKAPAVVPYSNEGRGSKAPKSTYETPYDRMNRRNAEQSAAKKEYGASTKAETARLAKKSSGAMDPNTLLPKRMASGGSVSSRADGIAQRGKTRGKTC